MRKLMSLFIMASLLTGLTGCATVRNQNGPLNDDVATQAFFEDLERSDFQAAYDLFGKGLSQRVSFDQFDQFMQALRDDWGRVESVDIETLPFHRRPGEEEFIPLGIKPRQVKRYTYLVNFSSAQMNFDLTLTPEGDQGYKIEWFSVWGSSIYMTSKIQEKLDELFSNPNSTGQ